MADTDPFPTIHDVLVAGDNIQSFIAGADWKAGQMVAFHGTGVSDTLHPAVKGTTAMIKGIALYDVTSGDRGAVACRGCRCKVANATEVVIDAGDPLEDNDNAIGGTVSTAALVDAGVVAVVKYIGGYAEQDIAANVTGVMEVAPATLTSANNA